MKPKQTGRNLVLLVIVAFLAFPSDSSNSFASQNVAKRKKPLITKSAVKVIELRNLEQLKEAFQRDSGKVRLVTILSPT